MRPSQPFRKCHLQILRSLYVGQVKDATRECQSDRAMLGAAINVDIVVEKNGAFERKKAINDITSVGSKNNIEGAVVESDNVTEGIAGSEIWDLIELFLKRRTEYRPHKERQIHWAKINAEAHDRLNHLTTIAPVEEEKALPTQRSSSLTPRTPLFSVSGRAGAKSPNNLSLTPQSSNRNSAPKLSQDERELASTIPAWKLINQVLQRRSKLCTNSCESFRSQPFLAKLRNEAEMRCSVLERALKRLKEGSTPFEKQKHIEKKREGSEMINGMGKRRKLSRAGATKPTIPSSLGHFFSDEYTGLKRNGFDDECLVDEEAIMETEMKLCLWSSLLSSVKEIVDEAGI
eukprot:CAMPEP_0183746880 /NCGR_PEP_ID=MMETSP0737-20130205/66979_1 /TAXON_ID=385413 /ORGANISM="Thalassiosira miniscula, Strain CCMP1093" /LENGTH=345 /DNA_ID=CAMNT_0025982587 /DNA_START=64 /DNA_END=1101 /DNA_ORIENTATION=+